MIGPTVSVFEPLWIGTTCLYDMFPAADYTHTIEAIGGYWSASFSIRGDLLTIEDWIQGGLGRHIEVYNEALEKIWEGFVNAINANVGPLSVQRGPLLDIANRVNLVYSTVDTSTTPPTVGQRTSTGETDDTDSQALYAIVPKILSTGGVTDADAVVIRDTYLEEHKLPKTTKSLRTDSAGECSATIECLGYVHWLNYPYQNLGLSGPSISPSASLSPSASVSSSPSRSMSPSASPSPSSSPSSSPSASASPSGSPSSSPSASLSPSASASPSSSPSSSPSASASRSPSASLSPSSSPSASPSAGTGLWTYVGQFLADTAKGVGETQSITGLGFQPEVVLFWWSGTSDAGEQLMAQMNLGFGAAISSVSRFAVTAVSEDNQGTSDTYSRQDDDHCVIIYSDAATVGGIFDFVSMDADGFTLDVDQAFGTNYNISYLAIGGVDLTNVYIGNNDVPVAAGNYQTTGVGFEPDAVIICSASKNLADTGSAHAQFDLGWATGASNQGVVAMSSIDNAGTSNTSSYGYSGECNSQRPLSGSMTIRESFVSFDADGFTLNHLEGATTTYFHFVCLKGGSYSVGSLDTRTDGNDITEVVGFDPAAILFASANRTESTQDTPTDHARISIGAASSITRRAVVAISDEDGLDTTEVACYSNNEAVYAQVVDDAMVGLMDIKSFDALGFTCVMDDADPSACFVTYLAIGAT